MNDDDTRSEVEEAQEPAAAEPAADALKDESNRAEVAQRSQRDARAQPGDPTELPVADAEENDAAETSAQPVQDAEIVRDVEDDDAARLDALPVQEDDSLRATERERFPDLPEHIEEMTGPHDRSSPSDLEGFTPEENVEITQELDRIRADELHHAVEVYILRGIESYAAERKPESWGKDGAKGFRDFVDDLYTEQREKVALEKEVHQELHRALKAALAEEDIRVSGSAKEIMQQLERQQVTETQLLDALDNAYRTVFSERPGLVSDEQQAQILKHVDDVRESLRTFGPGRSRYR